MGVFKTPTVGDVVSLEFEGTGSSTGFVTGNGITRIEERVTSLNALFNGVSGLIESSNSTTGSGTLNGVPFTSTVFTKDYFKVLSPYVRESYGLIFSYSPGFGRSDTTYTNSPPDVDSFATLALGETRTYVSSGTSVTAGISLPSRFSSTTRVTFVGKETVTVPAGTFNACRYDYFSVEGTASTGLTTKLVSRDWVYGGAPVKSTSFDTTGNSTLQLKSGMINGVRIQ